MPTTDRDCQALTYLAARLRDETHGANHWDQAGIMAVLQRELAGTHLATAIERILGHATDPDAKTPGAIKRPYVPEVAKSAPKHEPYDPRLVCRVCGLPEPHRFHPGDHRFLSVEAARAIPSTLAPTSVRQAIGPTREWTKESEQ